MSMRKRTVFGAGRGRLCRITSGCSELSLETRDDDTTLPDIDDVDDVDDPDTEDYDDDDNKKKPATATTAFSTVTQSSTSDPALSSATRSIPTLTAIAHTPTFPSSTTTARAVEATTLTSLSRTKRLSTVTASTSVTAAIGSAITASASDLPLASSAARPQYENPGNSLDSTPAPQLSAGAKAGIAFGVISAVALLVTMIFLIWKHKARKTTASPRQAPENDNQGTFRSESEVMADLMASAHAMQNGGNTNAYPQDKPEQNYNITAEPQPQIRNSIASWLRRHHPLNLNPLAGRASTASSARTTISQVDEIVPPPSTQQRKDPSKFKSVWSDSTPETPSEGNSSILSFYGMGSRTFSDSIRGTWNFPSPRARSFMSQNRNRETILP